MCVCVCVSSRWRLNASRNFKHARLKLPLITHQVFSSEMFSVMIIMCLVVTLRSALKIALKTRRVRQHTSAIYEPTTSLMPGVETDISSEFGEYRRPLTNYKWTKFQITYIHLSWRDTQGQQVEVSDDLITDINIIAQASTAVDGQVQVLNIENLRSSINNHY